MKKVTTLVLLLLYITIQSQEIKMEVKPIQATVYLRGAKVLSKCEVNLKQGKNIVKIIHLPNDIDNNTFKVSFPENTTLLSVTPGMLEKLEKIETPESKALNEKSKLLNKNILKLRLQIDAIEDEKKLLDENKVMGNSEQGWTATEIQKLANYYGTRKLELSNKKFAIEEEIAKLNDDLLEISKQLGQNETSVNPNLQKTLTLEIYSNQSTNAGLQISYIVQNTAGWVPTYDIKAISTKLPIQLVYKATVFQRTGQSWENIQLTLSSYKPSANQNRPILSPLYVREEQSYNDDEVYKVAKSETLSNSMQMREEEKFAKRKDIQNVAKPKIADIPITSISSSQMNVIYTINGTQSLKSQDNGQTIIIDKKELPATYKYHVVPTETTDVFLLALISDWQKLNLINGDANIYLEDNYMGKTYINTNFTKEEYPISLGVDERIVVKRNQLLDKETETTVKGSGKRTIITTTTNRGKTIKVEDKNIDRNKKTIEEFNNYEITMKNNTNDAIQLEVLDQIPISEHNQIKVINGNLSNGDFDVNTGSILWNKNLNPGARETIYFNYTVVYPKEIQTEYYNK
ncbi:MAG: DUF4139 domain-containing protein [Chitinophagales bacterium]|jgi:uncharacterized protein (TIGR02231 family)|nr:DUF4139 domain-containing protein [Sphingobacteriales bacterium]